MKTAKFALPLLALLPVGLALYGCGKSGQTAEAEKSSPSAQTGTSGHPSEAEGRKVYEYDLNHRLAGSHKAHVVSFHQTDGQTAEAMGVKVYNLFFEAQIQQELNAWDKYAPEKKPPPPETVKGTVSFEQTEKGWRGTDGNVY